MKLTTLLFLASITSLFAQNYVITTKGDSLPGSVKLLSYDLLDRVQVNADKKTILTAMQVRSVFLEGETYRPARLGNAVRFMKVLKAGYLSLYAFKPENQSVYDGRMLIKKDGTFTEVPNLGFKKVMTEFLGDCETVSANIKDGQWGRRDVDAIIAAYNKCMGDKTNAIVKQVTILETSKDKLATLSALRAKIEQSNNPKVKDALDLLADLETKIRKGDTIPNYQIEALKALVADMPNANQELNQILLLLK
jgi:hypothetical protein